MSVPIVKPEDTETVRDRAIANELRQRDENRSYVEEVQRRVASGEYDEALLDNLEVAGAIGAMAPGMILYTLPFVPVVLANAYLFTRAAGNAYTDVRIIGATHEEAVWYAILSGGAEVIIERLGGDIFGKGVDKIVDMLGVMPAANAILKIGKTIFGEGFEEILSGIADNALRNITGVNDTPQQMDWDATLDDALFAVKTSVYLGSFGNMNLSNDIVLTDLNNGNIVNTGTSITHNNSANFNLDNLTRAQRRNIETFHNVIQHNLKNRDFSGTLRELQGDFSLREDGRYWDHITEMVQSYKAIQKIKKGIEGSLLNPNMDIATREFLDYELTKLNEIIQRIEELFRPYGGI